MITDEEIDKAFDGTEFGQSDKRELIIEGLMKISCGYSPGHTIREILYELNLTTSIGGYVLPKLTKIGKQHLYGWFIRGWHEPGD